MNKFYEDSTAECPYYREEGSRLVVCEGFVGKSSLQLVLGTKVKKQQLKKQYCCHRWKQCPLAQMLNRLYDYEP